MRPRITLWPRCAALAFDALQSGGAAFALRASETNHAALALRANLAPNALWATLPDRSRWANWASFAALALGAPYPRQPVTAVAARNPLRAPLADGTAWPDCARFPLNAPRADRALRPDVTPFAGRTTRPRLAGNPLRADQPRLSPRTPLTILAWGANRTNFTTLAMRALQSLRAGRPDVAPVTVRPGFAFDAPFAGGPLRSRRTVPSITRA